MQQRLSIQTAFKLFLLDEQSQDFARHTLRLFLHGCTEQDVNNIDDLTTLHIKRFFVQLQGSGLSSAYMHSHARAIKTFCSDCVRDNIPRQYKVLFPIQLDKTMMEANID